MYPSDVKLLDYDPARSAALLDEAGWRVDPNDGWRYKEINGQKVRFEFTLLMSQGSSTAPKVAAIFQEDLKRLGVEMRTREMEWAAFLEKVQKHEFQAETAGWGTGTDPDTGWNLWRTDQYESGRNYGGYSNPRIDELFEEGRKEFDFKKRAQIYQEIHWILYEDQPYTWLWYEPILAAFNKRIHGVQFSPRGVFNFNPSFAEWWVARSGKPVAMMWP
jgi:peptide/nickel transport system substrate-binding protein